MDLGRKRRSEAVHILRRMKRAWEVLNCRGDWGASRANAREEVGLISRTAGS
ncbi:hypothetical protein MA16_Dca028713 [Dendrobium catenatum]|uniref:Uncharacterized protein n=1 Tax=Dendrobium catenatum TaxID=906689 RepID=A0A2I0VH28_9ASPA|nr:hypothetical protein MA16_Dca028713 [Dendrobium catenatum]